MAEKTRKTDRRTIYTKKVIEDAFFTLLKEKDYDRITVTDICKIAGINRSTFYVHFLDSRDVFETLLDEVLDYIMEHISSIICHETVQWALSFHLTQTLMENKRISILLSKGLSYSPFLEKYSSRIADCCLPYYAARSQLSEPELHTIIMSMCYSNLSLQQLWLKNNSLQDLTRYNALFNQYIFDPCHEKLLSGK